MIAVGLIAYTFWLGLWSWPFSAAKTSCAPATASPTAAPIKETSVRVFNATNRRGLALNVARDLQQRGFLVSMWDNDPTSMGMKSAAEVRYGPDGLHAARTVAAQVKGNAVLVLDGAREGVTVDLVLGKPFQMLRPMTEAERLLVAPMQGTAQEPGQGPHGCTSPAPQQSGTRSDAVDSGAAGVGTPNPGVSTGPSAATGHAGAGTAGTAGTAGADAAAQRPTG